MGVDLCMTANVVTAMDEPSLTSPYPAGKTDSIVKSLMAVMGFLAQSVDNKGVAAFDIRQFVVADGLHIGDVDKAG